MSLVGETKMRIIILAVRYTKQGTDLIGLRRLLEGVISGMDPFGSLGGYYGLQTASDVRSDLRVEISDLNYLHIHVCLGCLGLCSFVARKKERKKQTDNCYSCVRFAPQLKIPRKRPISVKVQTVGW